MASLPALVVIGGIAACLTLVVVLLMLRRRRKRPAAPEVPEVPEVVDVVASLPRRRLRSQLLVVADERSDEQQDAVDAARADADDDQASLEPTVAMQGLPTDLLEGAAAEGPAIVSVPGSVHEAPTREFAAYVEELAVLSVTVSPTRELSACQSPTRELEVAGEDPATRKFPALPPVSSLVEERVRTASGLQPRTRLAREHDEEDETLQMRTESAALQRAASIHDLLCMLGPNPAPDLSNIEIYYRLGVAYRAAGDEGAAHRCFDTVEAISPGYREVDKQLEALSLRARSTTRETPVHHVVSTSGLVPAQRGELGREEEQALGRRGSR